MRTYSCNWISNVLNSSTLPPVSEQVRLWESEEKSASFPPARYYLVWAQVSSPPKNDKFGWNSHRMHAENRVKMLLAARFRRNKSKYEYFIEYLIIIDRVNLVGSNAGTGRTFTIIQDEDTIGSILDDSRMVSKLWVIFLQTIKYLHSNTATREWMEYLYWLGYYW